MRTGHSSSDTKEVIATFKQQRFIKIFMAGLLLAFLVAFAIANASSSSVTEQTPYYHTVTPFTLKGQSSYAVERRFVGTVSAKQHADIGFEQSGKISKIWVDVGEAVKKGTLLAQLDVELLLIEAKELKAQLVDVRSKLQLVQSSLKRQQSLKTKGFSSEQRLDELNSEKTSLIATITRVNAGLSSVESRKNKATLKAPFDGIITRRFADQGAVLSAGMSVMRLQEEGKMEAHVGVPARILKQLEQEYGQKQLQEITLNGETIHAEILALGADMNPVTHTISVRLSLPNVSNAVNGELVFLNITETLQKQGFWIPVSAITDGMRGLWTVYVISPEEAGTEPHKIEARDIKVEYATESQVFVQGAISEGELIIKGGLNRVTPNQRVKLKTSASSQASQTQQPLPNQQVDNQL